MQEIEDRYEAYWERVERRLRKWQERQARWQEKVRAGSHADPPDPPDPLDPPGWEEPSLAVVGGALYSRKSGGTHGWGTVVTYGPGRVKPGVQVGSGWIRWGRVYFGHLQVRPAPDLKAVWQRAFDLAERGGVSMSFRHVLAEALDGAGVAGPALAALGLTAEAVRDACGQADRRPSPPPELQSGEALLGPDEVAALKTLGIDFDELRGKIESEFGPAALDEPAPRSTPGREAPPIQRLTFGAAASIGVQAGRPTIGRDEVVAAALYSRDVRQNVLEPLGLSAETAREKVEAALVAG